jgi:hypothetical protein
VEFTPFNKYSMPIKVGTVAVLQIQIGTVGTVKNFELLNHEFLTLMVISVLYTQIGPKTVNQR